MDLYSVFPLSKNTYKFRLILRACSFPKDANNKQAYFQPHIHPPGEPLLLEICLGSEWAMPASLSFPSIKGMPRTERAPTANTLVPARKYFGLVMHFFGRALRKALVGGKRKGGENCGLSSPHPPPPEGGGRVLPHPLLARGGG